MLDWISPAESCSDGRDVSKVGSVGTKALSVRSMYIDLALDSDLVSLVAGMGWLVLRGRSFTVRWLCAMSDRVDRGHLSA